MTSQYETNLWLTHVIIVWLAEPIRRCVHWRTQVFKIEGVCLQAFPSFPSPLFHFLALVSFLAWPKPRILFLGLSLLQNQIETLATQARIAMMLHWLSQPFYVFETSIVNYQSSKGQVKGLFILTHDSIRPYLTISERTCILTTHAFSLFNYPSQSGATFTGEHRFSKLRGLSASVSFLPFIPLPLLLPTLSFFGSRFISLAARTENPVPRSFFTPKPKGNAWYAG